MLGALSLGYLFRYHAFLRSLRAFDMARRESFAEQAFPLLSRSQITQLGTAHREGHRPRSSYTCFDREKAANTLRVGVFGCSFVYGAEAAPGQDFPSQLQRLFETDGQPRVEVLNFGVGAFGVQQSYLLWQYLAGEFDLDLTIYNLYGFHRGRDNTFIMLNTIFAPVHARYVLDGEGLRLIRVPGGDRRSAAEGYFRLMPRWASLRFDAKTPPQIRALLPEGNELPSNPFYYRRDAEKEFAELYDRIFADMAAGSERLLVLLNDGGSSDLMRDSSEARTFDLVPTRSEKFTWDRSGLYRAPKNHPSALGYHILARDAHAILTGRLETGLPDVEILGPAESGAAPEMATGLSDFDDVVLSLGGLPAAIFVTPEVHGSVDPFSFKSSRFDSILDVSGPRDPLFIALEGEISGEDLRLRFSVDGSPEAIVLGGISLVGGRHIGVLRPSSDTARGDGWVLRTRPDSSPISVDLASGRDITDIRLEIGGVTVLIGDDDRSAGSRSHRISWRSGQGELVATRGHPEQNADAIIAAAAGDYCITTREGGGAEKPWCTRRWQLDSTPVEIPTVGVPLINRAPR